jgi:hypothetical protein
MTNTDETRGHGPQRVNFVRIGETYLAVAYLVLNLSEPHRPCVHHQRMVRLR